MMTYDLAILIDALPPKSQEDCCLIAALHSIVKRGPIGYRNRRIHAALAKGLFGLAFKAATADQRAAWVSMVGRAYDGLLA